MNYKIHYKVPAFSESIFETEVIMCRDDLNHLDSHLKFFGQKAVRDFFNKHQGFPLKDNKSLELLIYDTNLNFLTKCSAVCKIEAKFTVTV